MCSPRTSARPCGPATTSSSARCTSTRSGPSSSRPSTAAGSCRDWAATTAATATTGTCAARPSTCATAAEPMPEPVPATTSLSRYEARTAAAVFERLFPADEHGPGAGAIGVLTYRDQAGTYRLGLAGLDLVARQRADRPFADCDPDDQDALLAELEAGRLPGLEVPDQREFFALLRAHLQEGLFADPVHGGNRDKLGWRFLRHPGFWPSNTPEENLATEPVTKGGVIQSLEDVADLLQGADGPREPMELAGYDPQRGAAPPAPDADVVLVGVGAMGAVVAPILAGAGLKVVGLEAGPWRTTRDFLPDELRSAYYCRGDMGAKFLAERP